MVSVGFASPESLWFLVFIPVVIFLHFFMLTSKNRKALPFGNFKAISRIKGIEVYSKNIFVLTLTVLILVCLVLSMAGMSLEREVLAGETSYVIAIDSSRSMEATDIIPSRIEAAKETAVNFVERSRLGTEAGVVSFSGSVFVEQSLTDDLFLIVRAINNIRVSSIGGTDLHDAIISSSNLVLPEGGVVVLLSDGQSNVGSLSEAIDYAAQNNVVVHTIAVGTSEGGETGFGISKVDEDALEAISQGTGGEFFRASSKLDLENSFNDLGSLKLQTVRMGLSRWLLMAAVFLVFVLYLGVNGRYRVFP